jgi:hypothetical protein
MHIKKIEGKDIKKRNKNKKLRREQRIGACEGS